MVVVVLALALAAGCRRRSEPAISANLVMRNNQAVGLMGQYNFDAAAAAFEALHTAEPAWPGARLNFAIALVNRQGPSDSARAEAELRALAGVPEVARRARYTLALLLMHDGRDQEAGPLLAGVAEEQPPDGFAAYFAGQLQLASDPAGALEWFRRASARVPLLRSAHYGAFLALRRLGRDDEAQTMLSRFQALERHPQALVAEFEYHADGAPCRSHHRRRRPKPPVRHASRPPFPGGRSTRQRVRRDLESRRSAAIDHGGRHRWRRGTGFLHRRRA